MNAFLNENLLDDLANMATSVAAWKTALPATACFGGGHKPFATARRGNPL
jgi:hypothetical protein